MVDMNCQNECTTARNFLEVTDTGPEAPSFRFLSQNLVDNANAPLLADRRFTLSPTLSARVAQLLSYCSATFLPLFIKVMTWTPVWATISILCLALLHFTIAGDVSICKTPACMRTFQQIQGMMDTTYGACDAPHLHFCGKWLKDFHLPSDESSWSTSFSSINNKTREVLRNLLDDGECPNNDDLSANPWDDMLSCHYKTCIETSRIDSQGIHPFISFLRGRAPRLLQRAIDPDSITNESAILTSSQRQELLSQMLANMSDDSLAPSFFSLSVAPNVLDSQGKYVLYLSEGGLGLKYRQYEQNDSVQHYMTLLRNVLTQFITDVATKQPVDITLVEERIQSVLQIEQDLQSVTLTPEEERETTLTTNPLTPEKINSLLNGTINFDFILSPLLDRGGIENIDILMVDNPNFFSKLGQFLDTKWTWESLHDYFLLRLLLNSLNGLPMPYRKIKDAYTLAMTGSDPLPRWKVCLQHMSNTLGWVLSKRYVEFVSFPRRRKEIAENLVKELKMTFRSVLKNVQWMDLGTKIQALLKLKAMTYKLAYPDWLMNGHEQYFERYYGPPNLTATRSYFDSLLHLNKASSLYQLKRLGQIKDLTEWEMFPQTVNAYFNPVLNEIVFPLSIMQEPFLRVWNECQDNSTTVNVDCSPSEEIALMKILTYGGIGSVIGHELTHGFDDQGRHFGPNGELIDWWSKESSDAFELAAQCVSQQYSQYRLKFHRPGSDGYMQIQESNLSGNLTLGENIADNGGLKLALLTLQRSHPEYFTKLPTLSDELSMTAAGFFFTAFSQLWCTAAREKALLSRVSSDPHSPGVFRIIGTMSNMPSFADAFRCQDESNVVPSSHLMIDSITLVRRLQSDEQIDNGNNSASLKYSENSTPNLKIQNNASLNYMFDNFNGIIFPKMSKRCLVW